MDDLSVLQRRRNYQSHARKRASDSSLFDEICDDCLARDFTIGPDELSDRACTGPRSPASGGADHG
jgi:hypothetical protein